MIMMKIVATSSIVNDHNTFTFGFKDPFGIRVLIDFQNKHK